MNKIEVTSNVNGSLDDFLKSRSYSKIAVLVDENTKTHCYPLIKNLPDHEVITIKSGEENKTIETCGLVWERLTSKNFDRNTLLINLGGGVIGDLGGFCARTYKRGINFINIPTTLLAQVDASIGGKLGIDFNGYKNQIGLFSEPDLVIIDTIFLASLPLEQLRSGFAEVIKHYIISDKAGWSKLDPAMWSKSNWISIVTHSVKIKSEIVNQDPTEQGIRKILNFGHTVGHAIESVYLSTDLPLLHGEAIAIGMICESYIAYKKEMLSKIELEEITKAISMIYSKFEIRAEITDKISMMIVQDKKNKETKILAALPNGIGRADWDCQISTDDVVEAISYYNQT